MVIIIIHYQLDRCKFLHQLPNQHHFKGADDLRNAPPICCPRTIILPRTTKKHTHTVSTKPFEAATCSDGLCVQLYNSITYSKKEKNTKNSVILRQPFSSPAKKSSSWQPLNFHQRNQALRASFDVFYIITLSFCGYLLLSSTYTLSAPQKIL